MTGRCLRIYLPHTSYQQQPTSTPAPSPLSWSLPSVSSQASWEVEGLGDIKVGWLAVSLTVWYSGFQPWWEGRRTVDGKSWEGKKGRVELGHWFKPRWWNGSYNLEITWLRYGCDFPSLYPRLDPSRRVTPPGTLTSRHPPHSPSTLFTPLCVNESCSNYILSTCFVSVPIHILISSEANLHEISHMYDNINNTWTHVVR